MRAAASSLRRGFLSQCRSAVVCSSRCSSASSRSLEEVTREGRQLGLLHAPGDGADGGFYKCCTTIANNPFAAEVKAVESLEQVRRKQLFLREASRIHAHPKVAMLCSNVNQLHLEAVVAEVQMGYACEASAADWERTQRRTTGSTPPTSSPQELLQLLLWLEVAEPTGPPTPLPLFCPLSRAFCHSLLSEVKTDADAATPAAQALLPWFQQLLQGKRVIASGQLRMEERYDGDLQRIVQVPSLLLPVDGFRRGLRDVDQILAMTLN